MSELTIAGRVLVRESQQGLRGVLVRVVRPNDGGDERTLGSAVTTGDGRFVIACNSTDGGASWHLVVDAPHGAAVDKPLAVTALRLAGPCVGGFRLSVKGRAPVAVPRPRG